jgi:hypothetical protein
MVKKHFPPGYPVLIFNKNAEYGLEEMDNGIF